MASTLWTSTLARGVTAQNHRILNRADEASRSLKIRWFYERWAMPGLPQSHFLSRRWSGPEMEAREPLASLSSGNCLVYPNRISYIGDAQGLEIESLRAVGLRELCKLCLLPQSRFLGRRCSGPRDGSTRAVGFIELLSQRISLILASMASKVIEAVIGIASSSWKAQAETPPHA